MTLQEHINKLKKLSQELVDVDGAVRLASNAALVQFQLRVFQKGQTVSGNTFQYNSTDPLYVYPSAGKTKSGRSVIPAFGDTAALKPPRGKYGETEFANGKKHVTTWVESYKALRGLVKRETGFVNFVAFGDLKSDIINNDTLTTRKVSDANYKISSEFPENQGKLKGLIKKYPNVFKLSESEKKEYYKAFDFQMRKLLNNYFNA